MEVFWIVCSFFGLDEEVNRTDQRPATARLERPLDGRWLTLRQVLLVLLRRPKGSRHFKGIYSYLYYSTPSIFKALSERKTWKDTSEPPVGHLFDVVLSQVGDAVTGTVTQIYCPGGVSVDVGCETLAFLEVEETQKFEMLRI